MGCLAAIDFSPSHHPGRESWPQGVATVGSHLKEKPATGMHTGRGLWLWMPLGPASAAGHPQPMQGPGQQRAEQKAGPAGPGGLPGSPLPCCSLGGWRAAWEPHAACGLFYLLSVLPQNFRRRSPGPKLRVPPTAPAPRPLSFPGSIPRHILHFLLCLGVWFWETHQTVWPFTLSRRGAHREDVGPRPWSLCYYIHLFSSSSFGAMLAFYQAMTHSGTDPWSAGFCSVWVPWTRSEREFSSCW